MEGHMSRSRRASQLLPSTPLAQIDHVKSQCEDYRVDTYRFRSTSEWEELPGGDEEEFTLPIKDTVRHHDHAHATVSHNDGILHRQHACAESFSLQEGTTD